MHFYYLDESGCTGCNLQDEEQPIFVLGGISVRDEGWNATQEALAKAVNQYFCGALPADFELHANELLSPDGDGPFAGHDRARRNAFARCLLQLIHDRRHDVHFYAVDKRNMDSSSCSACVPYSTNTPYHLSYDYLITYINWFIKNQLGQSARGMLIIDAKAEFQVDIERITRVRRFDGPATHRVKWISE
ncbi:MAG: DUF3800 domain-containing protein, partial [Candidatus Thorarchaeota archaeon]